MKVMLVDSIWLSTVQESNLDLSIPLIYEGVLIRLQIADVYNYWPLSEMFFLVFSCFVLSIIYMLPWVLMIMSSLDLSGTGIIIVALCCQ